MRSGDRPGIPSDRPPADATEERQPVKKRYPLWVPILRGFFFLLALGFTCASLIYLNTGNEGRILTIFLACMGGAMLIAFLGMFRSTVFEAILLVAAALILLNTIYFEFRDDLAYMHTPETITDSVVVAELPGRDSIRAVRFLDARVQIEDTVIIPDPENYEGYTMIAPLVDTWRDTIRRDSVYAFVTHYSYSNDFSYILEQWADTCNTGIVYWQDYNREIHAPHITYWKQRKERTVTAAPVIVERTCYLGLNDGREAGGIISVFVMLFLFWVIIISIVRGVSYLIRISNQSS